MNKIFKNSVAAFLITAVTGFILVYILSGITGADRIRWSLTIALIFGISNIGYLLILYFSDIYASILKSIKLIIFEIVTLFIVYFVIGVLIDYLPAEFKYEILSGKEYLKFFLKPPFDYIYTYVLVTLLMILYSRLFKATEE